MSDKIASQKWEKMVRKAEDQLDRKDVSNKLLNLIEEEEKEFEENLGREGEKKGRKSSAR